MKMIPMCDGHICPIKARRDGTASCSSRILNRVDAMPISSHLYVVVKDEMGNPLISIPFWDIV